MIGGILSVSAFVQLLLLLTAPTTTHGAEWVDPFFSDPGTVGVTFKVADGPNNHHQRMLVEEELPWPFTIAIVNYKGSTPPTIRRFFAGDRNVLSPSFVRHTDDRWLLRVNGRLDYESIEPDISFELTVPENENDAIKPRISLTLLNILDNPPRLDSPGVCMVDELQEPHLTDCIYLLYDPDGMANNAHTFRIVGQNKEEELFEFVAGDAISLYEVEYRLRVKKTLLFEERELYSFTVFVTDAGDNEGSTRVIVEVEDLPNLPPKWTKSFVSDRFDEKTAREYLVVAIDGDTKINKRCFYQLRFDDADADKSWTKDITIGKETGILKVAALNRDILKQEVFNFYIIAYEFDDFEEQIESSATIILNDINDNLPLVTIDTKTIHIWESTFETLAFDEFRVNDVDLALNAQYTVLLTEVTQNSEPYSTAFTIIPGAGYQESNFIVSVINTVRLDYEDELWREFDVKVRAVEDIDSLRFDEKNFRVALDNWNDEEPIFQDTPYAFSVLESVPKGGLLGKVLATDRDTDDRVEYSIVGYLSDQITITETGEMYSNTDELLDYQRQTSVVVQIAAKDTLRTEKPGEVLHTTYEQVLINVLDVNNVTPELRMPRATPSIIENSAKGTVITDEILAIDPDTTATLVVKILWEESYATKNGRRVDPEDYENCFIIEVDATNRNRVIGTISINPEFPDDVDYEKYEVLYLTIHVIDTMTELGVPDSTSVITVRIEDENDNAPVFAEGTADVNRMVMEASLEKTVIGNILATDIDGPEFNVVRYFIESINDTPDWVNIHTVTGELTVSVSNEIDCDVPPREFLNYRVTATDSLHETKIDIGIFIIDTNNKIPAFLEFVDSVSIYENQTEGLVISVTATDLDRDQQYRDFEFQIDYSSNRNQLDLFAMEDGTGDLVVQLQNGQELDRDEGVTEHDITIVVTDNKGLGVKNTHRNLVKVILLDVNDNAPVLPSPSAFQPKVNENIFTGSLESQEMVEYRLIATDKDEGVNAEVSFRILSITPYEDTANPAPDIEGVFDIKSERKINRGTLVIKKSLRGFYGTWQIEIEAYDHGDEGDSNISLSTTETYLLVIEPYNFNVPKITYPKQEEVLRLRYPQNANGQLYTFGNENLPDFVAVDEDGGVFGQVEFRVTGSTNDQDHEFFHFVKTATNKYQLQILKAIEDRIYFINFAAVDGGDLKEDRTNLKIVFVNQDGNPVFTNNHFETVIVENDAIATVQLPLADDPKNEGVTDPDELTQIYYFLSQPSELFIIDKNTNKLSLKQALEWTWETEEHDIVVIATNTASGPVNPDDNSKLAVKIIVEDVNDKPPKFELESYGAGITTDDALDKIVLKVRAIDPDKDDVVTYHILKETMEASPSLSSVKDIAFEIVPNTDPGEVKLQIKVLESYSGYFTFTIQARDLVDHTDEAQVRIYIIGESNRVSFIFRNTREEVEEHRTYIATTLKQFFEFECYIDDVQPYDSGSTASNSVEVRAHFVKDNIAVEGDVIRARTNEIGLITEISIQMYVQGLNLFEIPGVKNVADITNKEDLLRILLIVVTVVFATITTILIVACIFRTRSLNRQLKAYSASDIDTAPSQLNRREAPTTNVFSVEGSNPAMHNHLQRKAMFDEESIQSDDSDMIGFDDHPEFGNKNDNGNLAKHTESVNVARIQDMRQNSKNPMANGATVNNNNNSKDFDNDSLTRF